MTNRTLVLLSAACAFSWMLGASAVRAQRPVQTLSEPVYRELRRLSLSLNERAQRADEQARRQESWISRRDRNLLGSIAEFARGASRFDKRLANYGAAPWEVDGDLQGLLRSAQDIQDRVRHSRYANDDTLSGWNEIVDILSRMAKASRSGDGAAELAPAGPGRDEYGERRNPPGPRESGELAGLARELEDRAARAHGLAQQVTQQGPYRREFFQSIRDFHDQSVAFRRSIDSGSGDRTQIRAEAARLLDLARRTDQSMRRSRAFPEVWDEWQGAIRVLQKILGRVGG